MAIPTSRSEFKEYCLRQLGKPVIKINMDDTQVEDCIDDAINHFVTYHYDGFKHMYLAYELTQADINRGHLITSDNAIDPKNNFLSITGIWPVTTMTINGDDFDVGYQYNLANIHKIAEAGLIEYDMLQRHLSLIDRMFSGERSTRFHSTDNKLMIDVNWGQDIKAGNWLILEVYAKIDFDDATVAGSTNVWNSIFLKKYCVAALKKVWGSNLKKFNDVTLPGGITLNGQGVYEEAVQELEKIEEEMQLRFSPPEEFFIG